MNETVWNNVAPGEDDDFDDEVVEGRATITVNGATMALEIGSPFKDNVQNFAREAGYGKYKVLLNGSEIKPSEAPTLVTSDMNIRITPFDSAA